LSATQQTPLSNPDTFIDSATDGNDVQISNGGSTSSTTISFDVRGVANPSPNVKGFIWRIDTASFTSCGTVGSSTSLSETIQEDNLPLGTHTFQISAVNLDNQVDPTPASWTFTITSGSSGTILPPQQNTSANDAANNQIFNNLAAQAAANANAASLSATVADATQQVDLLNPPFQPCSDGTDLAIYNIYGDANLGSIFRSGRTLQPISLLMYLDTDPTDPRNLIINNNSVYLKGILVAFPGDTKNQMSTDFKVTKVLTQCKRTSLVDRAEVIGGPSKGATKPAVVKTLAANDVPFDRCVTATNAKTPSSVAGNSMSATVPTSTVQQRAAFSATTNQNLTAAQRSLAVASSSPTPNLSVPGGNNFQSATVGVGGQPPDIATYIIRGTIDTRQIVNTNGKQSIVVKIFNDPHAGLLGSQQTARIMDANNRFAATFQVHPVEESNWIPINFVLHELSTECGLSSFVDRPMQIGTDPADFSTQPRRDGDSFQ